MTDIILFDIKMVLLIYQDLCTRVYFSTFQGKQVHFLSQIQHFGMLICLNENI